MGLRGCGKEGRLARRKEQPVAVSGSRRGEADTTWAVPGRLTAKDEGRL